MSNDAELRVHRDWIGTLQPVGLVVSPPALLDAQAFPDRNILKEHQALLSLIEEPVPAGQDRASQNRRKLAEKHPRKLLGFVALAEQVLGWKPGKLAGAPGGPPLPDKLEVVLPEFHDTLRPTYALPALKEDAAEWMMLIQELPDGTPLDEPPSEDKKRWRASPQVRLERLLRDTGVPIGVLVNDAAVRLVYAPRGESSGHVTWPVHGLGEVSGRPLLSALCMLLGSARLFTLPREQRLPYLLSQSRKYQNIVSTKLAGQVLEALNELLRGFQSANEAAKGGLLDAMVREDADHVYGGLLAVLLRLVFILYAEERGLLSSAATYVRNYSLVGLFEKLRADEGRFPDTMDQRYGAWSQLLVLFRMVHDGATRGDFRLPPRYGHLFDPDGWAFLEGRPQGIHRVMGAKVEVPKVADGVVLRVLAKLLVLDSDRLSYRALDVEQIGSVYENMMGFRLERALEASIGVGKEHVVVGLETLLAKKGGEREKHLKETAGVELSGKAAEVLKQALSLDDLIAALSRRISPLTPRAVPVGGLYLQPTDERRRSGSHYTPRELTEPIVRTTLRPILEGLGAKPTPAQILALKVCDPAMGSGAFLVETCRQLAEQLVNAYDLHGRPTDVPPDEDILLYAQRQVAQHCLYGVDKNPFAVTLGKLSLWLATLARDHAFTFLDHSIRQGDSLVGLSREQIASFNWTIEHGLKQQIPMLRASVDQAIGKAIALRQKIQDLANSDDVTEKRHLLDDAEHAIAKVRTVGDCVVASFFSEENPKAREDARTQWESKVQGWLSGGTSSGEATGFIDELRSVAKPVHCFHWVIEFPEVFSRDNPGFDAIVGNPPFLSGTRMSTVLGMSYFSWLTARFPPAGHLCDEVAYFFRRSFQLLRSRGMQGLVATKTIRQGDTRAGGLVPIIDDDGHIYAATRRLRWPGKAAVIVSTVHIAKGFRPSACVLDGRWVPRISAYLVPGEVDHAPLPLANPYFSLGSKIYGQGFLFDDVDVDASPVAEIDRILSVHPASKERILPYIGGRELNQTCDLRPQRSVIYLSDLHDETELKAWPQLAAIVRAKVKPGREVLGSNPNNVPLKRRWWAYQAHRPELYEGARRLGRVLAIARVSESCAFAFLPGTFIFSEQLVLFHIRGYSGFAILQCRAHETWARFFSSSMKDDLRYTASDCYETFPFPIGWEDNGGLEIAGDQYYAFRLTLMAKTQQGLTDTYNRFHDPNENDPDILKLREFHAAMDRAVLDAYGWTDIQPTSEFLLDYEEEDDDSEAAGSRRKKKPWHYRWPDDVRDEVLARLLQLNAQRAKEQSVPGDKTAKPRGRAKGTKKAPAKSQARLFGGGEEE